MHGNQERGKILQRNRIQAALWHEFEKSPRIVYNELEGEWYIDWNLIESIFMEK